MKKNILKIVFVFILVTLCTIMLFGCELLGSNKNDNKDNDSVNSDKEYTIMYSDGKTVHSLNVKSDEIYSIDFPLPQKEGYTFMGLFDAEFGGTQYVSSTGVSVAPYTDNRNITLFPQFAVNEYTLKLDYGESTGMGRSLKVRYGDNMPDLPGNLTIDGQYYMNFVGWFVGNIQITGSDGMSYDLFDNQIIKYSNAENVITLKAKFEKNTYNINFYSKDGSKLLKTARIPYGEQIADYTKDIIVDGKTVATWSTWIQGEVFDEIVTSDLSLYALLYKEDLEKQYTIMYSDGENIHNINVMYGESYSMDLPLPKKEGYTFTGLFDAEVGGTQYVSSTGLSVVPFEDLKNLTLYIRFSPQVYNFILNYGDATPSGIRSISVYFGNNIYSLPGSLTINGSDFIVFEGWFTEPDCGGTKISDSNGNSPLILNAEFIKLSNADKEINLYAGFSVPKYTVTFKSADGDKTLFQEKITHGETFESVLKGKYPNIAWSTVPNSNQSIFVGGVESDMTVYAIYTNDNFRISYVLDSKENSYSNRIAENDMRNKESYIVGENFQVYDPTRGDYDYFLGWYEDKEYNIPFTNDLSYNPRDLTLYAKWDVAAYYDSIDSTPWSSIYERVVIDWSNEENTNFKDHTNRIVNDGRYNNFDITNQTKEITFIGSNLISITNFRISLVGFNEDQELIMRFINFNFMSDDDSAILLWECGGLNLTIEINGNCSIGTMKKIQGTAAVVNVPNANLSIQGIGVFTVTGGNGRDGEKGKDQTLDPNKGGPVPPTQTTRGENGSNGSASINCNKLSIFNEISVNLIGGNGGKGGNGGNVLSSGYYDGYADLPDGGAGGNGGDGSAPINLNIPIFLSANANLFLRYGNGGNGGNGGQGGCASQPSGGNGSYPDGKGHGGDAGKGGSGYVGGNAGNGGNGGYTFTNKDGTKKQQGTTGDGGRCNVGGDSYECVTYTKGIMRKDVGTVGKGGRGGHRGELSWTSTGKDPYWGVDRYNDIGRDGNYLSVTYNITII